MRVLTKKDEPQKALRAWLEAREAGEHQGDENEDVDMEEQSLQGDFVHQDPPRGKRPLQQAAVFQQLVCPRGVAGLLRG